VGIGLFPFNRLLGEENGYNALLITLLFRLFVGAISSSNMPNYFSINQYPHTN
jgi:hypothetical protein